MILLLLQAKNRNNKYAKITYAQMFDFMGGIYLSGLFMANANNNLSCLTQIDKALSFTQVKNKEHIKTLLPKLETNYKSGFIIYQTSPLKVEVTLLQNEENLIFTIDITNSNNYEWFINKTDHLYFYLQGGKEIYDFTNSNFVPSGDGMSVIYIPNDDDFRLIRPNETLTFQRAISVEEIYLNWKNQDIFVFYRVSETPVTIANEFLKLYDEKKSEGVYYDDLRSNQIRFRCINYDQDTKQCQFDIDLDDHTGYWET